MCIVAEILEWLELFAPPILAEDYDNVGLLVGDRQAEVTGVICALDLSPEVLQEAIEKNANVIVTHHPLLFHPIKQIKQDTRQGELLYGLIRAGIHVIAMHTNLDNAEGGLNDYLAAKLGIVDAKTLIKKTHLFTVSVYVPESHAEVVKQAIFSAGGGQQAFYDECSFSFMGDSQFLPLEGAEPYSGEIGKLWQEKQVKLEIGVRQSRVYEAVAAMLTTHPYEEPAFSVVENQIAGRAGTGRAGFLKTPMKLGAFCEMIKRELNCPSLRVAGDPEYMVRSAAVCSGAGEEYYGEAQKWGVNAYITGDVRHHNFVEASKKTALIDAGHYFTEAIVRDLLTEHLQTKLNEVQYKVNVMSSQAEQAPFVFI